MIHDTHPGEGADKPPRSLVPITEDLGVSPENLKMMGSILTINEALPGLDKNEPTALLLDINNLYRRARDNNWSLDYARLKEMFEGRCNLRYAGAFTAVDRANAKSNQWVKYMDDQGYHVTTMDLKRYISRTGESVSKGNMDIQITIAALSLSEAFGHIILGTCDGDFVPLVEKLREGHFRKVSVMGITNENRTGMSESLIRSADNFYDLTRIREYVEYIRD